MLLTYNLHELHSDFDDEKDFWIAFGIKIGMGYRGVLFADGVKVD